MIQRIQSLYLLLGAIALTVLLFLDPIWNGAAATSIAWFLPAVLVVGALAAVVALISIFLYGDRKKQRGLIVVTQGVTVVVLIVLYLGLYLANALFVRTAEGIDVSMLITLLLPLLAYVMFFLARRAVSKDIELVRSMDRLR